MFRVQDLAALEHRVDEVEKTLAAVCSDMKWIKYLLFGVIASIWGVGAL